MLLDVEQNRRDRKWSRQELAGRLLWGLAWPLFAGSPRLLWAWRRALLRLFGAKIGQNVHIYPSVRIAVPWNVSIGNNAAIGEGAILYSLGEIRIGDQVTISQRAHLCAGTHDYTKPEFPLIRAPVTVGDGAWICAEAFIGPGVCVGAYAIVGARAVAVKDIGGYAIVAGNPARCVGVRKG
jgi:putative colanic acid biosynthesis acetyltransferase WcaF